ncbi:hypothetical protein FRB94_000934 [Tulasnella sp. JGI-2019a]|nr:hypothetical protein FRB94_000934 [Tulasnella sp. JGI-2019a]
MCISSRDGSEIIFQGQDGDDITAFIQALKRMANTLGRPRDNDWLINAFKMYLAGPALRWYSLLDSDVQPDFNCLRIVGLKRFGSVKHQPLTAIAPRTSELPVATPLRPSVPASSTALPKVQSDSALLGSAQYSAPCTRLELQMNLELDKQVEGTSLVKPARKMLDCKICFDTLPEDDVAGLEGCDHRFCRECLSQYVQMALEDVKFPIVFPVCVSSPIEASDRKSDEGASTVQITETRAVVTHDTFQLLGISEKHYNKWVELEMGKFSTILNCSRCRNSVFVDKHDLTTATIITCPMGRGNLWCKKCSNSVDIPRESDHSCDGIVELDAMIQKEGWKRCPICQIPVERTVGCNHMTCKVSACNTHFCYVDGAFICQTQNGSTAKEAFGKHYSQNCSSFSFLNETRTVAAVPVLHFRHR